VSFAGKKCNLVVSFCVENAKGAKLCLIDVTSKQKIQTMRYLLLFMLLVAIFVVGKQSCHFSGFGPGTRGKGPVKTETRDVQGFNSISLEISANVEASVSENYSIEVEAQENLLPILKTELEDGRLRIWFDENVSYSKNLKIRISAPEFNAFFVAGSGTIRAVTPVRSEKMTLDIAGSGDIFLPEGDFGTLKTNIAGSGGIDIGGKADFFESSIAGSGDVKAERFTTNELVARIAGSGAVHCDVSQKLKAEIVGSGDVYYSGEPSVETDISGSGKVKKI
jgi:hypothetical protein